jgi:uncharacterized protein
MTDTINRKEVSSMDLMSAPAFASDLYSDHLSGDIFFFYTPHHPGKLVYVDRELYQLLPQFNGDASIHEIAERNQVDGGQLIKYLEQLKVMGVLRCRDGHGHSRQQGNGKKAAKIDAWFHLTNSCNLNCTYCYIHKDGTAMSYDTAVSSIAQLAACCDNPASDVVSIRFAGGEPLLKFDLLKRIISYCETNTCNLYRFGIITNGILLSDHSIVQYLKEKNIAVAVSLDGPEVYHNLTRASTRHSNPFKATMCGIETALQHGLKVNVLTTVAPENLPGLPELVKMMVSKGLHFRFSLQKTLEHDPALAAMIPQAAEVLLQCFEIMTDALESGKHSFDFNFNDIQFDYSVHRICGAGSTGVAVSQHGDFATCGMGLFNPQSPPTGKKNVLAYLEEQHPDLLRFSATDIPQCKDCPWCYCCAAGCPLQNKSLYQTYAHVSPYCQLIKQIMPTYIRLMALKRWKDLQS